VSGQKLEQVEQGKQTESDYTLWWLLGGIFFTGMISPFIRVKQ